jgi:L-alanine-DL-glutamate epimerase-like enolase superfamily enzyme
MRYRDVAEAFAGCSPLDALGLAFLEDAFPAEAWRHTRELASRLRTPLAAGEDAPGAHALLDLVDAVLVLRVDATASGGLGDALRVATVAAARGRAVMTHAFPDLHAHLAGDPAVGMVEMIPDATGVNPIGELLARRQRVVDGDLVLSEEPGHGAPLDWDRVTRSATAMSTIEHREDVAT